MELEFDKEIDAILRKAGDGDEVTAASASHLDADEISAFAENALPQNARQKFTAHLAECARCRKILSNLISLNSETENKPEVSTFPAGVAAEPLPWYRRLFAFPQLAYAMGALVLVFSGFMAYVILQNTTGSESTIARKEETGETPRGTALPAFSANTSTNAANSNAFSNATTANSNMSVAAANTATNTNSSNTTSTANIAAPTPRATPLPEPTILAKTERGNVADDAKKNVVVAPPPVAGAVAQKETPKPQQDEEDKTKRAETRDMAESQLMRSQPAPMAKKPAEADETRKAGGKTFRRVGGVWFDADYSTQPQTSVRRGSDEYKRLDAGLRSIAENLSGTVVVLWKNKAYRIQ